MTTPSTSSAIKLNHDQFTRSLKAKGFHHSWLYYKNDVTIRTHNNSIFLDRVVGEPFACLVCEMDRTIPDSELSEIFGSGTFEGGGVSPYDKENMNLPVFYIKP